MLTKITFIILIGIIILASCGDKSDDIDGPEEILQAPSDLIITSSTDSSISIAWNDNSVNEDYFYIERSIENNQTFTEIAQVGANVTMFTDIDLTRLTTYYYRVRAGNIDGFSSYSDDIMAVAVYNEAPNEPSNPQPYHEFTGIPPASYTLGWNCSDPDYDDTLRYDIYLDTNNPPTTRISHSQVNNSYSLSNLESFTTYFWQIIAYDRWGLSTNGDVWQFTTGSGSLEFVGGVYEPQTGSIFISDNYAYVADLLNDVVKIYNVSNPANISWTGSYGALGQPNDIFILGSIAFITFGIMDGISSLHILDITNPASPQPYSSIHTPGYAYSVYVSEGYAFVTESYDSTLQIINVSDLNNPVIVREYNVNAPAIDIFINNNYAYITCAEGGLKIFDVSNPITPSLVGTYNLAGDVQSVFVLNNLAYLSFSIQGGYSGLQILGVTSPSNPEAFGSINIPSSYAGSVYVNDGYAYVVDWIFRFEVIDVSNSTSPLHAICAEPTAEEHHADFGIDIFYYNDYLFLTGFEIGIKAYRYNP